MTGAAVVGATVVGAATGAVVVAGAPGVGAVLAAVGVVVGEWAGVDVLDEGVEAEPWLPSTDVRALWAPLVGEDPPGLDPAGVVEAGLLVPPAPEVGEIVVVTLEEVTAYALRAASVK